MTPPSGANAMPPEASVLVWPLHLLAQFEYVGGIDGAVDLPAISR